MWQNKIDKYYTKHYSDYIKGQDGKIYRPNQQVCILNSHGSIVDMDFIVGSTIQDGLVCMQLKRSGLIVPKYSKGYKYSF